MAWVFLAIIAMGLTATLIADKRGLPIRWLTKPIASAGFVGLALTMGATGSRYGRWVLMALVFGWIGDVALLSTSQIWFLAGLAAFLIGHVLYVVAFSVAGLAAGATVVATGVAAAAAVVIFRWLRPHLPAKLVGPVVAYVVVISLMVSTAWGAAMAGATALIVIGAVAFYLSDVAVARDRFVASGFANRVWGLPFYYFGQALLAYSVA